MMPRRRKEKLTFEQIVATFVKGCGLQQTELERLRVRDFYQKKHAFVYELQWIHVDAHDGIPAHEVPFMEPYAWTIEKLCRGRAPDDLVFPILPALDYARLREDYAEFLFFGSYETIGSMEGPQGIHEVGQKVKKALGLPRLDTTRRAWLRQVRQDWKQQITES
jgi:hypothetical protein